MTDQITGELREWARDHGWMERRTIEGREFTFSRDEEVEHALCGIADRIDARHVQDMDAAQTSGFDSGFASADDWYADQSDDTLAKHGLVRLPVDADGKPWHFEDTVTVSNGVWQVVGIASYPGARQDLVKNLVMQNRWTGDILRCNALELTRDDPTPAGRIRAAVRALTDEGGADGPALKDLLAVADELEGGE